MYYRIKRLMSKYNISIKSVVLYIAFILALNLVTIVLNVWCDIIVLINFIFVMSGIYAVYEWINK